MTTNNPYPKHIIDAVANVLSQEFHSAYEIGSFDDLTVYDQYAYKDKASYVLRTLWDASRIDTYEQLAQVPDGTVIIDELGYIGMKVRAGLWTEFFDNDHMIISEKSFYVPAHVIFWGDHDDR